ncbi:MAG: KEOPS complex N(6)-L-threonylcarbamoyladenine synthase Kae1 [Candidatus Diapherotrites archaeon]|nr:KEOPS complex N(6)-L-threonylcarbamoyladenine synthase Kae1 [Candidatus Diapherotrites archaeon]
MICLALECTAHTLGFAVVERTAAGECKILSNEKDTFKTESGGMVPLELRAHHERVWESVLQKALENSGKAWDGIDLIAFSSGPGMAPALIAGMQVAKKLALENKKPLLGVNHCVAHIEIGKALAGSKDPVVVYASGANTQIIGFETGYYRVFGETLDIGIGNLLDSFGRSLGLGFPAGPALDKWYFEGRQFIELPYTVKGMDLVFSGLETFAEKYWEKNSFGKTLEEQGQLKKDLAFSLLHNAFAELTEVTERALAHTEKSEVLVVGGVGASRALKEMLEKMCKARGAQLFITPLSVVVDNAAMIAWLALLEQNAGRAQKLSEIDINPKWRTDQAEAIWIKN